MLHCHMDSLPFVICKFGLLPIGCDGLQPWNFPTWACHYNVKPLGLENGNQISFYPNRHLCTLRIAIMVEKLFEKGKSTLVGH